MLRYALPFAFLPLLACCTPIAAPEATETVADMPHFTPQTVEDEERAATRALRAGKNTYAQSCGALRKTLDATALPTGLFMRVKTGDAKKLHPSGELTLRNAAKLDTINTELLASHKSVVCRIVTDLSAEGRAINPVADCTDKAYEDYVATYIASSEYEPYLGPDKRPAPVAGALTYWERCRHD